MPSTMKKTAQAATKGLEDLFLDGLKDIYYAEKKILKALPKMVKGAESEEVSAAFEKHRMETEGKVDRLERVFELIGETAKAKTCPAIDGILEEGSEVLMEYKGAPALDAGLIGAAQAVEHYEIARYGTLVAGPVCLATARWWNCSTPRSTKRAPPTKRSPNSAKAA
jgi:ferritin-like metal-binding protein YciE